MKKAETLRLMILNNFLLFSVVIMIASGLITQAGYHLGRSEGHRAGHGQTATEQVEQTAPDDNMYKEKIVMGLDYYAWTLLHKASAVVFTIIMLYHIWLHKEWYYRIIEKSLINKHKQTVFLTIIFIITGITGLIPWIMSISESIRMARNGFIEFHDKIGLMLIVFIALHLIKRYKWYGLTYKKLQTDKDYS